MRKHLVASEEQARRLRFVSSPTIRVNGSDIAFELLESSCGSDPCTDGCGGHVDCRVWVYRGQEYTKAPVGLIVDAVLREVYAPRAPAVDGTEPYELPENLERFFAGKEERALSADAAGSTVRANAIERQASCCSPTEQHSCCEPSAKEACCAPSAGGDCGCR